MAAADSPVSNVNDSPQSAQLVDEGKASLFFFYFTGRAFFFSLLEQLLSTSDIFLLYYGTGCLSTRWRVRTHRCADHNNTDCKYHSWQSDRH